MAEQTKNLPVTADQAAGEFLKKFGRSLEEYAIRKYDHNGFMRSAQLALADNPSLAECLKTDQGRLSLFSALRYAATTGLSLNPQEGKAALVGYKGKDGNHRISYQIMKNGMIDLAMESGNVEFITSDYVKEYDKFELTKTANGDNYIFSPNLKDRGDIIGFFAALTLKGGKTHVKWMTKKEVEEFRDKYSAMYKYSADNSAWSKSFTGMGIKTIMKALLRSVRISDDIDNAIGADDFYEADFKVEHGVSSDQAAEKLATKKAPEPAVKDGQGELL